MATPNVIENLPLHQRQQVVDKLLARVPTRDVAAFIRDKCDTPISHAAVARYRQKVVLPALKTASIALKTKGEPSDLLATAEQTRALTKAGIEASLIDQRMTKKFERYDRWLELAESKEDVRGIASIDTAETRALQLQAQLEGRINGTTNVTNNMLLVIPQDQLPQPIPRPALPATTIDAEIIERE